MRDDTHGDAARESDYLTAIARQRLIESLAAAISGISTFQA
jgi:hypothetical protein